MSAPAATNSSAIERSLADRIDRLLPQTQCRRCGFAGCRPYAEAIAADQADIDRCPPGGVQGIVRLAQLLGVAPKPLNPACGAPSAKAIAIIDEETCIGCALCLPACPVDAIIGAQKQLHTVIAAYCTGCELCIAPCPVDCIRMVPVPETEDDEESECAQRAQRAADAARERHARHLARRARDQREQASSAQETVASAPPGSGATNDPKPAAVLAAIERAKARTAATLGPVASNPERRDEGAVNGQGLDVPAAPRP